MAWNRSPFSGKKDQNNNNLTSLLSLPECRLLLGVGAGYLAKRIWSDPLNSKIDKLRSAPKISVESVNGRQIPAKGELVILRNGVVAPLTIADRKSTKKSQHNNNNSSNSVVLRTKEVHLTDRKHGRVRRKSELSVPFAITNGEFRVIVKDAGADHVPLEVEWEERKERWFSSKCKGDERWRVLRGGTELKNVFGKLSVDGKSGLPVIRPAPSFPAKCFAMMSRSEIESEVKRADRDDWFQARKICSLAVGIVSLGLISSTIHPLN